MARKIIHSDPTNFVISAAIRVSPRIHDLNRPIETVVQFTHSSGAYEQYRMAGKTCDDLYRQIISFASTLEQINGSPVQWATFNGNPQGREIVIR